MATLAERFGDVGRLGCGTEVFAVRGWLAAAAPALRHTILAAGRSTRLARGERLFSSGAPPGGIFGVVSGGIAVEGSSQWHAPRIGHVCRAGDWFGEGPALTGGARTMGFIALEDSQLLTVPLAVLRELMTDNSELTKLVGSLASIGSTLASAIICDLLIPDAPRRTAAVMLRVTGALDGVVPDNAAGFVLTQTELGELANVSRNHINHILATFERAGWIAKSYCHLRLLDVPALTAFVADSR
nr:Crp/Fnr family transcriptional regulator [Polymorphobacter sp.]